MHTTRPFSIADKKNSKNVDRQGYIYIYFFFYSKLQGPPSQFCLSPPFIPRVIRVLSLLVFSCTIIHSQRPFLELVIVAVPRRFASFLLVPEIKW